MAEIYKRVPGKGGGKTEKVIALNDGVQEWLDDWVFEAGVRAEEELIEHRAEGHSSIDIEEGDIDRYLILNDERGQKAAMSIEYGREAYGIDENGDVVDANSPAAVRVVGAMDGLFILHKATHIKPKKRGKIDLD
jgi:hypothetical protein